MTKMLMKDDKMHLYKNPDTLPNVISLALSFGLYLAQTSSKVKERYFLLALDLVYFVFDNFKLISAETIDHIVNSNLIKELGESLKNKKDNEKANQSQKIITELYL